MLFWKYVRPTYLLGQKGQNAFRNHYFNCARVMSTQNEIKGKNELLKYLRQKIEATGPITIAEYMKEVLTNPLSGYYMQKDVFGNSGDFITSPEISQLFGEIIAIWFYNEWAKVGKPKPFQLVELGPGRGTLADDILKIFCRFIREDNCLSLHLVEVSPFLSGIQKKLLCPEEKGDKTQPNPSANDSNDGFYDKEHASHYGIAVTWHSDLKSVPEGFSMFWAHEFFDALPIHQFQKTVNGWREILIGYQGTAEVGHLHYVISRNPTPASQMFINEDEKRDLIEICPASWVLMEQLTKRIKEDGGISLIIDYGHEGNGGNTFRSFRKHKQHDPLIDPGTADLTADVDFYSLKKIAQREAITFGPTAQGDFLKNMAIDIRLQKLLLNASPADQEILKSGHDFLTNPEKMGDKFKFLAIFPEVLKDFLEKYPPAGFT